MKQPVTGTDESNNVHVWNSGRVLAQIMSAVAGYERITGYWHTYCTEWLISSSTRLLALSLQIVTEVRLMTTSQIIAESCCFYVHISKWKERICWPYDFLSKWSFLLKIRSSRMLQCRSDMLNIALFEMTNEQSQTSAARSWKRKCGWVKFLWLAVYFLNGVINIVQYFFLPRVCVCVCVQK